jgi:hypothetical protein
MKMSRPVRTRIVPIVLITLAFLLDACLPRVTPVAPTAQAPETPTPQPPSKRFATNYNRSIRFEHISLEQGLSQSVVNVIMQDQQGFLWIGTEDGLNRYDGYSFKVYRPEPENTKTISDRWVTSLVQDQDGYIWVGTRQGGLNRFDPRSGTFTAFRHSASDQASLSSDYINSTRRKIHSDITPPMKKAA